MSYREYFRLSLRRIGNARWLFALSAGMLAMFSTNAQSTSQNPRDCGPEMPKATLGQMRELVAKHIELIRANKVDELRRMFTPRLREFITAELLQERRVHLANVELEHLVAEIRQTEKKGRHSVIVRRSDGRLLTVFVWHEGSWLADTLWFR